MFLDFYLYQTAYITTSVWSLWWEISTTQITGGFSGMLHYSYYYRNREQLFVFGSHLFNSLLLCRTGNAHVELVLLNYSDLSNATSFWYFTQHQYFPRRKQVSRSIPDLVQKSRHTRLHFWCIFLCRKYPDSEAVTEQQRTFKASSNPWTG